MRTSRDVVADFRSDTVTKPTREMLDAMMRAEVGDDVYGEDPTVAALEQETATLFGKEAALYVPSGTMANQLAIAVQTRPGDSVIGEESTHCFIFEAGAAAALSGVQFDLLPLAEGYSDAAIERVIKAEGLHNPTTTLLVVENTHNVGAGRAVGASEMRRIAACGKKFGLAVHCDGARIWNAAVATSASEAELVAGFDSVAVCFSKGLGAPVGSALVGSAATITRARKLRKRWGGGMRQAGYIAAGALHALRHHRARLGEDHRNAAAIAGALRELASRGAPLAVRYPESGTNLVYFRVESGEPGQHVKSLMEQGVRVTHMGGGWLRAVTHLDVGSADVERLVGAVEVTVSRS